MKYALASDFASRKRKRRCRRAPDRIVNAQEATGSGQVSGGKLYFDSIPDNALENVVRYLSLSPRAANWPSYLLVELLTRLYGTPGYLGEFCRTRFTSLCISDTKCIYELEKDIWNNRTRGMLWAQRKRSAYDVVIHGGGHLRTLFIGPTYARQIHNSDMLDDFSAKCANLTALSIESDGRAWIERFGARLEALELGLDPSRSAFFAIQNYCTNLRELTLNAVHKTDVGRSNIWQKIGATLEVLDVAFHFPCAGEIVKIEKHCRKIRHLHVEEEEAINTALASCLASYGDQLEFASLFDMNEQQLQQVVSSCKKAKFTLFLEEADTITTLNIIGAQLDSASVSLDNNVFDSDEQLRAAWDVCENLRTLHIVSDCSSDDLRRVCNAPKNNLKIVNLYINDQQTGDSAKEIIGTLANGTCALEDIELHCVDPPVGTFDSLVARNSSTLKKVYIYVHNRMSDESAHDVVDKFLHDTDKLEELEVEDGLRKRRNYVKGIEDLCRRYRYRHRRVCVEVLGYPYLR